MKDYAGIARGYIARVMSGEEIVCRKIRLTIERHVADLLRSQSDPDFPFYFDPNAGYKVCKLFEMVLPSKWPTTMVMSPWLITCTLLLYGWKDRKQAPVGYAEDGTPLFINPRRYRQAFLMWPRKMGKSAYLSVLCLNALVADGERGAEVYSAALVEEQARRVFDEAVAMRDGTPQLRKEIRKVGQDPCRRLRAKNNSEFRPLSRDKESMEGLNVHLACGDEVHKWTGRGAWDVLRYGMRSRIQPLLVGITTAPSEGDTTSICNTLYNYAAKILDGIIPDDRFFSWITEMDGEIKNAAGEIIQEEDAWDDETKWVKACPNLGVTVKLEDMRQEALEASNDAESLDAFKRYSLNIRVGALDQVIQTSDWDACARPYDVLDATPMLARVARLASLAGRICFAALDLALTNDTSALVLVFPPMAEDQKWELVPYFWIPNDNIKARVQKHQVPYDIWRDQGYLITTPGKVTDYDFIVEHILSLSKLFDMRELAYDPALASGLIKKLIEKGFKKDKVVKFAQTMMNYAAPCGDFIRSIARKEIQHDGHPVMRWQATNLRWIKNHSGLFMPDKLKSIEKIDGMVAAIMGYGRATHPDNAKLLKPKARVSQL